MNSIDNALRMLAADVEAEERKHLEKHGEFLNRLSELDPELVNRAVYVWEDRTEAAEWFAIPHPDLGNISPYRAVALAKREDVLALLDNMFHGIYG